MAARFPEEKGDGKSARLLLDHTTRDMLNRRRVRLQDHVKLSGLWSELTALGVCTDKEKQTIQLNAEEWKQVDRLVDHIISGTMRRYKKFREALYNDDQDHIVTQILDKEESESEEEDIPTPAGERFPDIGDDDLRPMLETALRSPPEMPFVMTNEDQTLQELFKGPIDWKILGASITVYNKWLQTHVMECVRLEGQEKQPKIDVKKRFRRLKLLDNVNTTYSVDQLPDILEENLFTPFDESQPPIQRVLLEGAAGSGKTTLCRHWVCQWADPEQRKKYFFLNTRCLVILVECRAHSGSLLQKVWHALPPRLSQQQKVALCRFFYQYTKHCQCVTDAVDEISLSDAKKLFQQVNELQVSVLATTRSNKVNKLVDKYPFDRLIVVAGFKLKDAFQFVEDILHDEKKLNKQLSEEKIKQLMAHVKDNEDKYKFLLENPQNCVMVALKLSFDKELSNTVSLSTLYATVEERLLERECARLEKDVEDVREDQQRIYRLAFETLMKQEVLISRKTLRKFSIAETSHVMVLFDRTCLITVETEVSWQPSHKSWLEYLGAQKLAALDPKIREEIIIYLSAFNDYDHLLTFTFGLLHETQTESALILLQSTLLLQTSSLIDLVDPSTSCRSSHPHPNLTDVRQTLQAVQMDDILAAAGEDVSESPLQLTSAREFIKDWYGHTLECQCRKRWDKVTPAMQRLFAHVRDCAKEAGAQYDHIIHKTFRLIYKDFRAGAEITVKEYGPGGLWLNVYAHTPGEAGRLVTEYRRTPTHEPLTRLYLHVPSRDSVRWWGQPPPTTATAWQQLLTVLEADCREVKWLVVNCYHYRSDGLLAAVSEHLEDMVAALPRLVEVWVWNPRLPDRGEIDALMTAARHLGVTRRDEYGGMVVTLPGRREGTTPGGRREVMLWVWDPRIDADPGATWRDEMKASGLVSWSPS